MSSLIAIIIGALVAGGTYCLMRRSIVKIILGIALLSQAINLMVFSSVGLHSTHPPMIKAGEKILSGNHADPLPQALVLTAIVIGFGLIAFCLALIHQTYRATREDDINSLTTTDT